MAALRTYAPDLISVIIGDRPITGFADGEGVKVSRKNDSFTHVKGMTGESARTKSNDKSGEITLTLMQTSPDNEYLSQLALEDEITGQRPFNILIRDQNGNSLYEAETAWINKPADAMFGKELTNREWVIACTDIRMFSAGSNTSI